MKIARAHERLKTAWGRIDRQHNELIAARLAGQRVLDVGCGYGALVSFLQSQGYQAEGIDFDPVSVEAAQQIFPGVPVRLENAETMERYPSASFDSIVLKDALHHLVCEGDFSSSSRMFRRLLVPGGRLVVLDPNPMWILKMARRISAHDDVEVGPQRALAELRQNGFEVRGIAYYEVLGLPLSGGYVGLRLVPNLAPFNAATAGVNRLASAIVNGVGLGNKLCWRYIIHADVSAA
jgi:SAM-dependent methyltransferase